MGCKTACLFNSHLLQCPLGIIHQKEISEWGWSVAITVMSWFTEKLESWHQKEWTVSSSSLWWQFCSPILMEYTSTLWAIILLITVAKMYISPNPKQCPLPDSKMHSAQLQSHPLLFDFYYSALPCLWYENLSTLETELESN